MRELQMNEVSFVAGGTEGDDEEIIVTAPRWTDEDEAAYQSAQTGCGALGGLAGVGSGLVVGGLCIAGGAYASGGLAVPFVSRVCVALGAATGAIVTPVVTRSCQQGVSG